MKEKKKSHFRAEFWSHSGERKKDGAKREEGDHGALKMDYRFPQKPFVLLRCSPFLFPAARPGPAKIRGGELRARDNKSKLKSQTSFYFHPTGRTTI